MTDGPTWKDFAMADAQSAVVHLSAEYCRRVDAGDVGPLTALFASDGTLRVGDRSFTGPSDLGVFFSGAPRGIHLAGVPFLSEVSDSEARSEQNFLFVADGGSVVSRGTYHDRIRCDPLGFVFLERIVDMHPSTTTAEP